MIKFSDKNRLFRNLLQQLTGNDNALDPVSPLIDLKDFRNPKELFNRIIAAILI